jgi:hypothetical protein
MAMQSPPSAMLARFLREELGADGGVPAGPWTVTAPLWVWRGSGNRPPPKAAWYFVTVTGDVAVAIGAAASGRTGGFGSVKVMATIGETAWTTSLFPSREAGGYLLPIKAAVRQRTQLDVDMMVTVEIALA